MSHGIVRSFLPGGLGGIGYAPLRYHAEDTLSMFAGAAGLLALFAIGLTIIKFAWVVRWYAHGPQVATPEGLVKTFYSEVGVDGHVSIGRAWVCLDPGAQAEFASMDDFETYWQTGLNALKEQARQATHQWWGGHRPNQAKGHVERVVKSGSSWLDVINDHAAQLCHDLIIEVRDKVLFGRGDDEYVRSVRYCTLVCMQSKTLLKGGDRWYLTSGTLDGPNDGQPTAEPSDPAQDVAPA